MQGKYFLLVLWTFWDHLWLFLLSSHPGIHQIPFFHSLINSVIMYQVLHEKLNNISLIYIVLESFQRASTCIILSLILTMAPEMDDQSFPDEETEAQRGPQSNRTEEEVSGSSGLPHFWSLVLPEMWVSSGSPIFLFHFSFSQFLPKSKSISACLRFP